MIDVTGLLSVAETEISRFPWVTVAPGLTGEPPLAMEIVTAGGVLSLFIVMFRVIVEIFPALSVTLRISSAEPLE